MQSHHLSDYTLRTNLRLSKDERNPVVERIYTRPLSYL